MSETKLKEFMQEFRAKVDKSHIIYFWGERGHCYSAIEHPLLAKAIIASKDWTVDCRHKWQYYISAWFNENQEEHFCVPPLIGELATEHELLVPNSPLYRGGGATGVPVFKTGCDVGCSDGVNRYDPEYIEGFISMVKRFRPERAKYYYLDLLEEWLSDHRAVKKFDEQFEQE